VYIDKEDLDELEFPQLLAEISPFAYSPKTREKILQLRPMEIDEAELSLKKRQNTCRVLKVQMRFRLMNMKILKVN
jgi:dsDNA-specific endonuclease/ATPase MutS2